MWAKNETQMCEEHVSVHDCSIDIQQYFFYDKMFISFFFFILCNLIPYNPPPPN